MNLLLDAQAGIKWDGEKDPQSSPEYDLALTAWNYLCDKNQGIDWSGLPYVIEKLAVEDIDALMDHLLAIKTYKPQE